jgi:hypothetical protein
MTARLGLPVAAAAAHVLGGGSGSGGTAPRASAAPEAAGGGGAPEAVVARRGVRLKRIGNFAAPVYVTAPPGDRRHLFVVEQPGRIRVLVNGHLRRRPFLDIRGRRRAYAVSHAGPVYRIVGR